MVFFLDIPFVFGTMNKTEKEELMTQINRTPFRKVADIPAHLLTSDKLKWENTGGGLVVLTTDGKRYAHIGPDGKVESWWDSAYVTIRPHGLSWEAAEALVNPPQPKPQPAKTEEPFRPGLPPAELRAVCKEWEQAWQDGARPHAPVEFVGEKYRFLYQDRACTHRRTDMSGAILWTSDKENFRPHKKTWAEVEALAAAKQKPRKHPVPIGGWVMRTDEGYPGTPTGTRAQVEGINEAGSYRVRVPSGAIHAWSPEFCEPCEPPEPTQEPTYIVACPKGRRKYVKYYLSQHIYVGDKDLGALPYSTADKPFWLGYVSAKLREELTALAPDIRFSVG